MVRDSNPATVSLDQLLQPVQPAPAAKQEQAGQATQPTSQPLEKKLKKTRIFLVISLGLLVHNTAVQCDGPLAEQAIRPAPPEVRTVVQYVQGPEVIVLQPAPQTSQPTSAGLTISRECASLPLLAGHVKSSADKISQQAGIADRALEKAVTALVGSVAAGVGDMNQATTDLTQAKSDLGKAARDLDTAIAALNSAAIQCKNSNNKSSKE